MNLPGRGTRRVAARLLTATTMSRIVDPVIADWQSEYTAAVHQRRIWRRRWIRWSGFALLFKALAIYGCSTLAEPGRAWPEEERQVLRRVVVTTGLATVAATVFFVWRPYYVHLASGGNVVLLLYLLPQALPVAAPLGLMVGILYGWRTRQPSKRLRNVVAILAGTTCLLSLVTLDRLVPDANQAFRTEVFKTLLAQSPNRTTGEAPSLARGVAELTLSGIRAQLVEMRSQGLSERARTLAAAYHQRIALAFVPLPLAILALAVVRRRQFGALRLAAMGVGSVALFFMAMSVANTLARGSDVAFLLVWLPHIGFLIAAALLKTKPHGTPTPTVFTS